MKKTIQVRLPRNVVDQDARIWLPFLSYTIEELVVKELDYAFVTYSGFTIDSEGLVKECHHDYPFQYEDYLKEAQFYYDQASSDPDKLIELEDDNVYLQIFHPWFNYGHWLFESILRLWKVREKLNDMILLLPDFYSDAKFIQESLEPFAIKNILYIPKPKSLFVKNLCLPQIKPIVDSYHKEALLEIRAFYLNYVANRKNNKAPYLERIYLSRKKSRRRYVVNEAEVEAVLKKYNFTTINADGLGFFDQVAIYSNANYLVSIMGAGLSNALFMKEGSSILEFHKTLNASDIHCKTFWYLADALDFNYYYQFCPSLDPASDIYTADLIVDINLLEENLKLMFMES